MVCVPVMGNNLRKLRLSRSWTHDQAASAMGMSKGGFIKLERGERRLKQEQIERAAHVFEVPESDILGDRKTAPLVGYVGAGALAHIFSEGQGPFDEVDAPDGSTEDTVAVEIRGESLGSFFDQWLVFYDDVRTPPSSKMLNRLCVVGVADGRILIKKLTKGTLPGHYTLLSQFEPPMYDQIIEWAALVKNMVPR
jgi:transcriptional regulator with XRE-family HTH domain